jgi:hypothetical protein
VLAPLDAPNEHGLVNQSKKWRQMLLLSKFRNTIAAEISKALSLHRGSH